ncbi:4-methylaminobutanoate oxidase (formaldehyde-forming) [Hamadaea flava]|uniref:NAD(P)/FAD-dependent oxidoreductase n=1 Tax=Hamadaea flava TaxID=1742688 RepID=A0ABV8LKW4_9ACTN|nr:FAD-dependent oxidoreductase [Hamadaea flava]MCP2324896.1 4-methylaminobutanoate oxidase (formaldehyde-forming) [Hamadaea flava]
MTIETRAVVIGGGIVGCSVAYHLASLGWTEITLLEQHQLTDGTTWHSAGFVTPLRGSPATRALVGYLPALADRLRAETGLDPGWRPVGGLRLAGTPERVEQLRAAGLEIRSPESLPALLNDKGVLAVGWTPDDGFVRPKDLPAALAAAATALGVTVRTGVRVTGLTVSNKRVSGVRTSEGDLKTGTVVLAAGAASAHLGHFVGATVPVAPVNHQYAVTAPFDPPLDPDTLPTVRDPDRNLYLRGAGGGLILGAYPSAPVPAWPLNGAPPLAESRTQATPAPIDELIAAASGRIRDLPEIIKVICGPEAFTPDGEPLVGQTDVPGLWAAAGMSLHGMALAGGVGKAVAELITSGSAEVDVRSLSPQRFGPFAHNRHWTTTRAVDAFARLRS